MSALDNRTPDGYAEAIKGIEVIVNRAVSREVGPRRVA